jgi:hypothetical protein
MVWRCLLCAAILRWNGCVPAFLLTCGCGDGCSVRPFFPPQQVSELASQRVGLTADLSANAFLLTCGHGHGCSVRPFFDGMAALRFAPYSTASGKCVGLCLRSSAIRRNAVRRHLSRLRSRWQIRGMSAVGGCLRRRSRRGWPARCDRHARASSLRNRLRS